MVTIAGMFMPNPQMAVDEVHGGRAGRSREGLPGMAREYACTRQFGLLPGRHTVRGDGVRYRKS